MIVTLAYYKDTYNGYVGNMSNIDIAKNIGAAEMIVNLLTHQRLVNGDVDINKLPPYMQENIKKSICILTEHYIINGGYVAVQQVTNSNVNSATVGKFSYSQSANSTSDNSIESQVPVLALQLLASTGLLYSGIGATGYVY